MEKKIKNIRLDDSDVKDIYDMLEQKKSIGEIADYIGCSHNTVLYYAHKIGYRTRREWTLDEKVGVYLDAAFMQPAAVAVKWKTTKQMVFFIRKQIRDLNIMITKQTFDIVNKNGDVMKSFTEQGKALEEFKKLNPNYVKLVQNQKIERVIRERKLDKNGNAIYEE